jgi:hypothetical protein
MSNPSLNHPIELTDAELEYVSGGALSKENGGDKTPGGNAFGVPTVNSGSKEHAPPGQNNGPGNS